MTHTDGLAQVPAMGTKSVGQRYTNLLYRATRTTFRFWERLGVHVTPVHFYQPIPDTRTLGDQLWERKRSAPGIDFRDEAQVELLARSSPTTAKS